MDHASDARFISYQERSSNLKIHESTSRSQRYHPSVAPNGDSSTDLNSMNENILEELKQQPSGESRLLNQDLSRFLIDKSLEEQQRQNIALENKELSERTHQSLGDQEMLKLIEELDAQKRELTELRDPFANDSGHTDPGKDLVSKFLMSKGVSP